MRVRRLLHETTSRLELAALQKADAVVDRLTFPPGPRPARTSAFPRGEYWTGLISALEGSLRLHRHRPGALTGLEEYLHRSYQPHPGRPGQTRQRTPHRLDDRD
jgi:hypothetical protein